MLPLLPRMGVIGGVIEFSVGCGASPIFGVGVTRHADHVAQILRPQAFSQVHLRCRLLSNTATARPFDSKWHELAQDQTGGLRIPSRLATRSSN